MKPAPFLYHRPESLEEARGRPTRDDVVDALTGQICRCTGYEPIVDAILKAAGS